MQKAIELVVEILEISPLMAFIFLRDGGDRKKEEEDNIYFWEEKIVK